MTIPSNLIDGIIFKSSPIKWSFSCSYETSYDVTADEMTVDASAKTGEFSASGQFDVSMRKVLSNPAAICTLFIIHIYILYLYTYKIPRDMKFCI